MAFVGTFLAPCHTQVVDGRLVVTDGVAAPKFLDSVEQRTFSGEYAAKAGQPVLVGTTVSDEARAALAKHHRVTPVRGVGGFANAIRIDGATLTGACSAGVGGIRGA